MKDFMVDKNTGDIVIEKRDIAVVDAQNEIAQQIRHILRSNNGEWYFNSEYGINYNNLLVKTVDNEIIIDEINKGLAQCTSNVTLQTIDIKVNRQERTLSVSFYALLDDETMISDEIELI